MDTLFTRIRKREEPGYLVLDEHNIFAILDVCPINTGHLLIIPYEEVEEITELSDARYKELWLVVKHLSSVLKKAFNAPKVGIAVEGYGVPHAHVHLVPVYNGNELNPERASQATSLELQAARNVIISTM